MYMPSQWDKDIYVAFVNALSIQQKQIVTQYLIYYIEKKM